MDTDIPEMLIKADSGVLGHHLLHSTADILLLYSAYSLPLIDGQGIQGSLHLHYPHHCGHVILWALHLHLSVSTQHYLGGQVPCCIL